GKPNDTHQKIESKFDEELIRFDLSSFKLTRTNEELFKENKQMLNVQQLTEAMDSLQLNLQSRKADYVRMYKPMLSYYRDSIEGQTVLAPVNALSDYEKAQQVTILNNALAHARSLQAMYNNNADEYDMRYDNINRYEIEWHRKFTLSIACFVLFLIGAPLGAIIRKGGLGVPIIVAIIFFLIFHVASITGEKMAKEGSATPISGMWAATAILLPIGLFLIYKATTDSSIFDSEVYGRVIDFFRKRFTRKQNAVI
ncbi:MAG TPA: LptF/LptG family permease, partial [Bacteroidia bacterium]|nr:LptF/LptG family permease [Bacteroidia bacterium]